jgi:hypothetical protein
MAGSSASLFTSMRRECLVSKSKIPPQLGCAQSQIVELSGEGVETFGFHDSDFLKPWIIQYEHLTTPTLNDLRQEAKRVRLPKHGMPEAKQDAALRPCLTRNVGCAKAQRCAPIHFLPQH